jgi:hypothetical protein
MRARERSLIRCREAGYTTGLTEHFNPHVRIRQDLYGFIDFVAMKPGKSILAVQVCNTHAQEHIENVCKHPNAKIWLQTGSRIVIHSWVERSKLGVKTWELDLTRIELVKGEVMALPF